MDSRILISLTLLIVLSACGGESTSGSSSGPTPETESDNTGTDDTEGPHDTTGGEGSGEAGGGDSGNGSETESGEEGGTPVSPPVAVPDSPPFSGTIFVDPDIVTADDPSAFQGITAQGTGQRLMYDRREGWVNTSPYLFLASYDDGLSIEIQVNPEFTEEEAGIEAARYAQMFGQLPTLLRKDVDTSWIHKGVYPWGGGNRNLLVHTGQGELYIADGIAEETLIHEGSHSSLDADYAASPGWLAAQQADPTFISTYAQDFPDREDIAESFLPYVALRYRRDRISDELAALFEATIPNRIQFFDSIVRDMYPLE
jgi:hypothetical protein